MESVGRKIWGNPDVESRECGLLPEENPGGGDAAVAGPREFSKSKYGSGEKSRGKQRQSREERGQRQQQAPAPTEAGTG